MLHMTGHSTLQLLPWQQWVMLRMVLTSMIAIDQKMDNIAQRVDSLQTKAMLRLKQLLTT